MSAATDAPSVTPPGAARAVTPAGLLAARLADLVARCPAAADATFVDDLRATYELAAGAEPYAAQCTTPESEALHDLAQATASHDWAGHDPHTGRAPLEQEMLSGHVEGQLLKTLVHATRSRRVLDIGMFTGYSALAVAEALPPGGRVISCEVDVEVAQFARHHLYRSEAGRKIDVRVGPAEDTLRDLARTGDVFDLVFLDADKGGYLGYVDAVLRYGLLARHGLLCVDNTLMQGLPWTDAASTPNAAAIAAFNREIADDPRVEQVLLSVRDGVTLIRHAQP